MVLYTSGESFSINLNSDVWLKFEEGRTLTVFLPQRKFDKVHKLFSDPRLPAERYTWLEFGWRFEDLIMHISGSYDNGISYREEITVELNQKEKDCIKKIIQPIEQHIPEIEFSQI